MLIINADDWGGWARATDAALRCFQNGRITSASAMVFMEDSERAAELSRVHGLDVGLHINFTQKFTAPNCPPDVRAAQEVLRLFLKSTKYTLLLYNPFLRSHFKKVFTAQVNEFRRVYQREPSHFDGHQHMHLCTNMVFDRVIPRGRKVRRTFSFFAGEKSGINKAYRRALDRYIKRNYISTDYFFATSHCLGNSHFARVASLARSSNVELMVHPEVQGESEFLLSGDFTAALHSVQTGRYTELSERMPTGAS